MGICSAMRNRVQNQVRVRKCNRNRNSNAIVRGAIFALLGFVVLTMSACNRHSEHWEALSSVESFIEEQPDSALVVLQGIDASNLSSAEERAKHALLLSMALDKNYIDKTDFEVLQPAIDYYEDNGSATDKLRTYYYQGRIYQNAGNDALAMEAFVNAISNGAKSEDIKTKARVYYTQSKIYFSLYEWENFVECLQNAAPLYRDSGLQQYYADCLIFIINGYTLNEDYESALSYIDECKQISDSMSISTLSQYYSIYLAYLIKCGSECEIKTIVQEYIDAIPVSYIDWLAIANAYVKINKYNEALDAVLFYDNNLEINSDFKYKALISKIYENLGRYEESLIAYKEFMHMSDSTNLAIMRQDTKFVEERHNLELQTLRERETKNRLILWAAIFIAVLLAVIAYIRYRLKVNQMDKVLAEQQTEKYRLLYLQMEEERDNLTNLLVESDELAPDIKNAVGKRLELLNKFFTAFITNNSDIDRTASKEMEELLANKDTFMVSTKLAFAGSHPKFIKYLEDRGLTDWEVSYCCLYALGLKGKEVGAYIKMRSHYNNSSEVREKLGINEHDTNLGIYIRKLLKSFE